MKNFVQRRKLLSAVGAVAMLIVTVMLVIGIYTASVAGDLPWQTDPTRVAGSITPFADQSLPTVFIPSKSVAVGTATASP